MYQLLVHAVQIISEDEVVHVPCREDGEVVLSQSLAVMAGITEQHAL
jgi:hypothetical protein